MKCHSPIAAILTLALCHTGALWADTITYQGRLDAAGQPHTGTVDMEFELYNHESGGTQHGPTLNRSVQVFDGLFQVELDFGTTPYLFGRWLQVTIEGNELDPRQLLTAAPVAIRGANEFASGSGTASGYYGTAMGLFTTAGGDFSTAIGSFATASGAVSTAMGASTNADGDVSTALGFETNASGNQSIAMGYGSTASGPVATAMGQGTRADGWASTAMGLDSETWGNYTVAMGEGSRASAQHMVAIGKYNSPVGAHNSTAPDRPIFVIGNGSSNDNRGHALLVNFNGNMNIAGTLTQNSDRNAKHGIAPVDSLDVLDIVSRIEISTWRYNHSPAILHMGPMAQDFHVAFGVGEDDTAISTLDVSGVALAAIQGLHGLAERQRQQIAALENRLAAQEQEYRRRLAALEAILLDGAEIAMGGPGYDYEAPEERHSRVRWHSRERW